MEVDIGDDYVLGRDEYCWRLMHRVVNKRGNNVGASRLETLGYYPTIELTLKACVEKKLPSLALNSVKDIVEAINSSTRLIKEFLSNAKLN
jgi:hypothetical protein